MLRWLLVLLLAPSIANATNFYIGNDGNDGNSGTSPEQAWKTIARLNDAFTRFGAGDSILFKRGDVFYGSIRVGQSGTSGRAIVFAAYGTGANPVISGFSSMADWVNQKNGTWAAPAVLLKGNVNMVAINGVPQRIGRFPNANGPDGGYLRYEDFNRNISITDNEPSGQQNWEGAEVVIRKNHWTAERCRITKHSGNTIFYTWANQGINTTKPPTLYNGTKGNGYFIQNDVRTLDQFGEWFLDSVNHKLLVYLGKNNPAAYSIKASSIDTLLNIDNHSFISIRNLDFEGAGMSAVYAKLGGNISIEYCNFTNMGAKAIHIWNSPDILIDHVNTNYVMSNAIQVRNSKQPNITITNCLVKNTGIYTGMGSFFDDRDYKALVATTDLGLQIINNRVDTCGLSGIQFQASNAIIRNNVVNYFCYLLDDGAGIYTYTDVSKDNPVIFTNRVIDHNVVLNGMGAPEGSTPIYKAEGIYLDGGTMNVQVLHNTIAHVGNKAIACNNPFNISIQHNTCFNNGGGWGATRLNSWENLHDFNVTDNIFYACNDKQRQVDFIHSGINVPVPSTIWEAIQTMGRVDNNFYNTPYPAGFNYSYAPTFGEAYLYPTPLSLENWQALSHQDQHSKRPFKVVPNFILKQTLGGNLVKNGDFAANTNGVMVYGRGMEGKWDNAGKLRVSFSQPQSNRFGLVHAPVGTLKAGAKYLLKFKTQGTTPCGIVRAYLRKTSAPYTNLVPTQTQAFGLKNEVHEFLFNVNSNEPASYVIEIEQNSGATALDDIELYEANATIIDLKKQVRFEYNDSAIEKVITLDRNYIGIDGSKYSGSISIAPFSSLILTPEQWR